MAHNLAKINGKVAMAYLGETPWHRLGTEMIGFPTVEAALKAASLDWNVELQPVFLKSGIEVPACQAVVRDVDGEVLSTVGDAYEPLQNAEAFGVLDEAVKQFGVHIETAGALGRGDRTWMLAKLPNSIEPIAGDKVEGYFLITTGHNGWTSYEGRLTPIRVVCNNTLTAAVSGKPAIIKLRHVRSQMERMEMVRVMVTDLIASLQETGKQYKSLANTKLTIKDINAYIDRVIGIEPNTKDDALTNLTLRKRDSIRELAVKGTGVELAPMTAWAAYNAVTEYVDHVVHTLGKADIRKKQADQSALFGPNFQLKSKALAKALELVVVRP